MLARPISVRTYVTRLSSSCERRKPKIESLRLSSTCPSCGWESSWNSDRNDALIVSRPKLNMYTATRNTIMKMNIPGRPEATATTEPESAVAMPVSELASPFSTFSSCTAVSGGIVM